MSILFFHFILSLFFSSLSEDQPQTTSLTLLHLRPVNTAVELHHYASVFINGRALKGVIHVQRWQASHGRVFMVVVEDDEPRII